MQTDMGTCEDDLSARYEIVVRGCLDDRWSAWFSSGIVSIDPDPGPEPVTTLVCDVVDQARLRGIMNRLWDLNLTLISIKRLRSPGG